MMRKLFLILTSCLTLNAAASTIVVHHIPPNGSFDIDYQANSIYAPTEPASYKSSASNAGFQQALDDLNAFWVISDDLINKHLKLSLFCKPHFQGKSVVYQLNDQQLSAPSDIILEGPVC